MFTQGLTHTRPSGLTLGSPKLEPARVLASTSQRCTRTAAGRPGHALSSHLSRVAVLLPTQRPPMSPPHEENPDLPPALGRKPHMAGKMGPSPAHDLAPAREQERRRSWGLLRTSPRKSPRTAPPVLRARDDSCVGGMAGAVAAVTRPHGQRRAPQRHWPSAPTLLSCWTKLETPTTLGSVLINVCVIPATRRLDFCSSGPETAHLRLSR